MKPFEEKKFNIGELKGISAKTIEEHLKLYAGYVKHVNLILSKIPEYEAYVKENADNTYVLTLLQRRFSFEFDGMRNHEIYFDSLSGGTGEMVGDSNLKKAIQEEFGSFDLCLSRFKSMALTRGIGWAMLGYDKKTDRLIQYWVDEQHFGHLTGVSPVLALDMWEHSYVADYQPSGKKQYVEDYFINLNWRKIEDNYANAQK